MIRVLKGLLLVAVGVYALVVFWVYLLQDVLMFPAQPIARDVLEAHAREADLRTFEVTTTDGVRIFGYHRRARGQKAVIFHHGNGGGVMAASWLASVLPGVDVIAFSYRGYPGSQDAPKSEAGLLADARAVWDHVTGDLGIPPENIVLHGQSLGGGVVHLLLDEVTPAAVVLDSTFTSAVDVAREHYGFLPVDLLFRHRFDSQTRAPHVDVPVLLLHGTSDRLIPFAHAKRLAELIPDSTLVPVPDRGHEHWLLDETVAREAYQRFVNGVLGGADCPQ